MKEYVVLDFETTGFGSASHVLQVSIIDSAGGVLLDKNIKPPEECFTDEKLIRMWEKASSIHGIFPTDVVDCSSFIDVLPEIDDAINDKDVIIYNKAFDMRYLPDSSIEKASSFICAMKLFTEKYGKKSKLSFAAKHCGFDFDENKAHNAIYDCNATLHVYKNMLDSYKT